MSSEESKGEFEKIEERENAWMAFQEAVFQKGPDDLEKYRDPEDHEIRPYSFSDDVSRELDGLTEKAHGELPEGLFESTTEGINRLQKFAGDDDRYDNPEFEVENYRLLGLLRHPDFIADERSVEVYRKAAASKLTPFTGETFTSLVGAVEPSQYESAHNYARPFSPKHLANLEKIIDLPEVWRKPAKGDEEDDRLPNWDMQSSIADLLEHLSKKYPDETSPLMVKLWQKNFEQGDDSAEVKSSLVYMDNLPKAQELLLEIAKKNPKTKLGREAKAIVNGKYRDALWAI